MNVNYYGPTLHLAAVDVRRFAMLEIDDISPPPAAGSKKS